MNDTSATTRYRHWRLETADTIAMLTLDVAEQSANVLSREALAELEQIVAQLAPQYLKGLILRSAKAGGFVAGADVREFERIREAPEATELARTGQRVLAQFAALPFPSVALIHGYCLGGGLELALACTYRVARDDAGTRLGLPEVHLGIHPGFAGTLRLPALIGDLPALDLMLSGRTVDARAARRLGLVDEIVPERHLLRAAQALLRRRPPRRSAPWHRRITGLRWLRPLTARWVRARLAKKADPRHYPAPYKLLGLWQHNATSEQEARSLGELLTSPVSRNLVRLFLESEALKRAARQAPHGVEWIHVVGAGTMGADIAILAAQRGFRVSLQDRHSEALARAVRRAHEHFRKHYKTPREAQEAMDRLMPDLAGHGIGRADLVIEAIIEDLEVKRSVFRELEPRLKPTALLATNTSSIPLEDLAAALAEPARLVGLHFFNPVAKMQLIEIVRGAQTGESALARARALALALDRLPLDVASRPGFLVNRVLMPYLLEAVRALAEGMPAEVIDNTARDFGMPMGPIELADTVGLDICLAVGERLAPLFKLDVPPILRTCVVQKRLGKKTGRGFYDYDARGRARRSLAARKPPDPVLAERLILRLLNEAMACLREGVVRDAAAVDLGLVYGAGFAPFRGGPMGYARALGAEALRHGLYRMASHYGAGFAPDPGWTQPELWQAKPA
jgi:3-hydroxyacyl-CoA dehydrogenase/enoyl-CoA hydratase/3-hydroxybutyryl-CoA epimerase